MKRATIRWGDSGLARIVAAGVEMALWDLRGKALGLPLYQLLGGLAQERLQIYASALPALWPVERTVELVQSCIEDGFTAVKLQTGFLEHPASAVATRREVVQDERRKVEAIRRAVGDAVDVALDHAGSWNADPWTHDVAAQVIGALAEFDLLWVEEPCAATSVETYARLRGAVRTPIAGGEDLTALHEVRRYLDQGAFDVIQPDVAWMPMGDVLATIDIVEGTATRTALHVGGTAVMRAASYHVALAHPGCFITEMHLEDNVLFDALYVEPPDLRDGYLYPPTAPGLGVQLPDGFVRRYALDG
jgi:L-alanine-DL-glutamate epimerase-like enolase superfamily enzyme